MAAHSESLFQTGWFVESLLTQTLIIHVIRTNKIPFLQSRPSAFLMLTSVAIMAIGVALPFTALGRYLGFTASAPLLAVHRHDAVFLRAPHAGGQGVARAPGADLSQGGR